MVLYHTLTDDQLQLFQVSRVKTLLLHSHNSLSSLRPLLFLSSLSETEEANARQRFTSTQSSAVDSSSPTIPMIESTQHSPLGFIMSVDINAPWPRSSPTWLQSDALSPSALATSTASTTCPMIPFSCSTGWQASASGSTTQPRLQPGSQRSNTSHSASTKRAMTSGTNTRNIARFDGAYAFDINCRPRRSYHSRSNISSNIPKHATSHRRRTGRRPTMTFSKSHGSSSFSPRSVGHANYSNSQATTPNEAFATPTSDIDGQALLATGD